MRVKERNHLHPIKEMQGETANSNTEAAKSYPKDLAEIINEDDYTKWQIFNADKTALCWEEMSSMTYSLRRKSVPAPQLQRTS